LREGFGRVFVEACGSGLPVIVNDFAVAREVLGEWGIFTDMTSTAAVAQALDTILTTLPEQRAKADERRRAMFERYDWSSLGDRYVDLFQRVARLPYR